MRVGSKYLEHGYTTWVYKEKMRMATQIKTTATKSIPTLPEPPLIGSLMVYRKDPFGFKRRILHNFGDIAKFHYGPLPFIMITAPELAHNVLVEHAYDFNRGIAVYNAFRPIMGNSLFISDGDFHREQRKLLAPSAPYYSLR